MTNQKEKFVKDNPIKGVMTIEQYNELADIGDRVFSAIDVHESDYAEECTIDPIEYQKWI